MFISFVTSSRYTAEYYNTDFNSFSVGNLISVHFVLQESDLLDLSERKNTLTFAIPL